MFVIKRLTASTYCRYVKKIKNIPFRKLNPTKIFHSKVRFNSNFPQTPCFLEALNHLDQPAIKDNTGLYTYKDLLIKARKVSRKIEKIELERKFLSILCPHSSSYVVCMWAGWLSGCVVVPLSPKYPVHMLDYFLSDSCSELLLSSDHHHLMCQLKNSNNHIKFLDIEDILDSEHTKDTDEMETSYWSMMKERSQSESWKESSALVVYTSGTTGKPKGVEHSHGSVGRMVGGMISEWEWSKQDVVVHSLPLHHIHGIVNVLLTPLMTGALCVMTEFKGHLIWKLLLGSADDNDLPRRVNVMMGVPTMYAMLLDEVLKNHSGDGGSGGGGGVSGSGDGNGGGSVGGSGDGGVGDSGGGGYNEYVKESCLKNIRLFVSGSAPLQLSILKKWEELTGHVLLERYGMTEVGMALGNPLKGIRIPGAVGNPFPFVEVAIAKNKSQSVDRTELVVKGNTEGTVILNDIEKDGELLIKGGTLFQGYLHKPQATNEAFTIDGWFKTGDTASYDSINHTYRIMGRTSVDVIKSGGYKLSAIQIENALLEHPLIREVAVVGVEDEKWGEVVAALVVLKNPGSGGGSNGCDGSVGGDGSGSGGVSSSGGGGSSGGGDGDERLTLESLREWCDNRMPTYQTPAIIRLIPSLERNAMGKINKKQLIKIHFK